MVVMFSVDSLKVTALGYSIYLICFCPCIKPKLELLGLTQFYLDFGLKDDILWVLAVKDAVCYLLTGKHIKFY